MRKYKHCPEFYWAKKKGLLFMIKEVKMVMYCSMLEAVMMRAYKQELVSYLKRYPTKHLKRSVRKEIREVTSLDINTTIKSVSVPAAAVIASAATLLSLSTMAIKRRQRKQLRP